MLTAKAKIGRANGYEILLIFILACQFTVLLTIANFLDGKEVMRVTLIKIAKAMGISIDKLRQPISDQEYMELRQEEKA